MSFEKCHIAAPANSDLISVELVRESVQVTIESHRKSRQKSGITKKNTLQMYNIDWYTLHTDECSADTVLKKLCVLREMQYDEEDPRLFLEGLGVLDSSTLKSSWTSARFAAKAKSGAVRDQQWIGEPGQVHQDKSAERDSKSPDVWQKYRPTVLSRFHMTCGNPVPLPTVVKGNRNAPTEYFFRLIFFEGVVL